MDKSSFPYPPRITELSGDEKHGAKVEYLIRLAALHHDTKGGLRDFSVALGLHPNTIPMAAQRQAVSGETAVAIEKLCGRKYFPRELFRPDLFVIPE